jgi:hypothetical protein
VETSTHFRIRTRRVGGWSAVLILVAVCSLTISLATRYNDCASAPGIGVTHVTIHSATQKRQHLDKDAARWVTPVGRFAILEVSSFYPRFAPSGPPVHAFLLDERLYNRPPPASEILS